MRVEISENKQVLIKNSDLGIKGSFENEITEVEIRVKGVAYSGMPLSSADLEVDVLTNVSDEIFNKIQEIAIDNDYWLDF